MHVQVDVGRHGFTSDVSSTRAHLENISKIRSHKIQTYKHGKKQLSAQEAEQNQFAGPCLDRSNMFGRKAIVFHVLKCFRLPFVVLLTHKFSTQDWKRVQTKRKTDDFEFFFFTQDCDWKRVQIKRQNR